MLRRLVLAAVCALLAMPATADSLVAAAKREKARREALKKRADVLDNKEIGKTGGVVNEAKGGPAPAVAKPAAGKPAAEGETAEGEAAEGEAALEWPERFRVARQRIEDAELDLDLRKAEVTALRAGLVNRNNPTSGFNQRGNLEKALKQKNAAEQELAEARKALDQLREEARRAGVPAAVRR